MDITGDIMKSKMRRFFANLVLAAAMAVVLPIGTMTSYAADGRIAFSDKTASVGSKIDINMKVTATGGEALSNATVMLSYDANMIEFVSGTGASGGAGAVRISIGGDTADARELVSALKFKALQAGTSKISVNTQEVYDASGQVVNINKMGSSTITVTAPANASREASLGGLQVSPGSLTPEFSADVLEYSVSVDADVTKLTIDAPAKDAKASVVLTGSYEDLQPGDNEVVCRVIAEDGATIKEYKIKVNRAGGGESNPGAPEGSIAVETPAKTVTIIPLDEGVSIPDGFAECTIKIDGKDAQGWIWATDTEHKYCVFYGMNEAGEKSFYRYDLAEKTMQRYFQDPMMETSVSMDEFAKLAEEHNSLLEDYKLRLYMIVGLGAAAAILLIIVIILFATRRRREDEEFSKYEEKLNDRKEPVRRVSEGLPGQRAKAQAERQAAERIREDDRRWNEMTQNLMEENPGEVRVPVPAEENSREGKVLVPAEEKLREARVPVPAEEKLRETRVSDPSDEEAAAAAPTSSVRSYGQTTFVPNSVVGSPAVSRTPIPPQVLQSQQQIPPQAQTVYSAQLVNQDRPSMRPQPQPAPEAETMDDDDFEVLDLD